MKLENGILISDLVSDRESKRYLDGNSKRYDKRGRNSTLVNRRLEPTVMVDKVGVKLNPIRSLCQMIERLLGIAPNGNDIMAIKLQRSFNN